MVLRESDYVQKITERVKNNLAKGYKPESLKWALVKQGYTKTEVDKIIRLAQEQLEAERPKVEEKPVQSEIISEPVVEEKKSFWKKIFG